MTNIVSLVQKTFEDIKMTDETGFEFWSARTLMTALGYKEWRKFSGVIERAKIAYENSSQKPENHFVGGDKIEKRREVEQRLLKGDQDT